MFRSLVASLVLALVLVVPAAAQAADPTPVSQVRVGVAPVSTNVGVATMVQATVSSYANPLVDGIVSIPLPDTLFATGVTISGTAGPSCAISDNDVTCTDVDLATFGSRAIAITVTPSVVGDQVLTASVTAANGLIDQSGGRRSVIGRVSVWPTSHRDVGIRSAYATSSIGAASARALAFNRTGIDTTVTFTATRTGTGDISSATINGAACAIVTAASAVCSTSIPAWDTKELLVQLTAPGQAQGTLDFQLAASGVTDVNLDDNAQADTYAFQGNQRSVGFWNAYASSFSPGFATVSASVYNQTGIATNIALDVDVDAPAAITSASFNGTPCAVSGQEVSCTASLPGNNSGSVFVQLTGANTDTGSVSATISTPGFVDYYSADNARTFPYRLDGTPSPMPPMTFPPPTSPSPSAYLYTYTPSGALRGTRLTFDAGFSAYPLSIPGLTATISAPGASLAQPPAPLDSCTGVGTSTLVCVVTTRTNSWAFVPVVGTVATGPKAVDVTVTVSGTGLQPQAASSRIVQRLSGSAGLRALIRTSGRVQLDGSTPGSATVTIGAFNAAATAADDATVQLPLPPGITPHLATLPVGCSWSSPVVTCVLGDVPAFEYASFDVPVTVATTLHGGRRLTATINAAAGLGATTDRMRRATLDIQNALLDRVTTSVSVSLPNLATTGSAWQPLTDHVARTGDRMLVRVDVSRTYAGAPRPALNPTTATLVLPAGLSFVAGEAENSSSFACSATGQVVTCPLGALRSYPSIRGTWEESTVDVLVDVTAPGIGSIQAFVDDQQLATDAYTATEALLLEVTTAPGGDLATRPAFASGDVGAPTRLVIPFSNLRASEATDATATIALPSGVSITGVAPSQGSCAVAGDLVCELGDVPGGHGGIISLDVTASVAGRHAITATLDSASTDPVPSNDVARSTFVASGASSVHLWGAPMMRLNVGTTGVATLSGQAAPAGSHDVEVSVQLPSTVSFVTADVAGCTSDPGRVVTCLVPKASQDADGVFAVALTLRGEAVGQGNVASWATSPTAPQSAWSGGFTAFRVVVGAGSERDLVSALNVTKTPVRIGSRTTLQFSVRNRSSIDAPGASATITLPAGLTHVVSGGPIDACAAAGQVLTCSFGTIPAGEYTSVDAVVQVNARPAGPITAQVTASGTDRDPSDDSDSAKLPVRDGSGSVADLHAGARSNCRAGVLESCLVTARVQNIGGAATTAATLTVALPVQVTLEYWKVGAGSCTATTTALSCSLGALAAGAIVDVRLGVSPNAAGRFELGLNAQSIAPADIDVDNGVAAIGIVGTGASLGSAPASATVADTGVGSRRGVKVTLTNLGATTQRLVPQLGGADAASFAIDRGCRRVLYAGTSCSTIVTFTPEAVRSYAAQLVVVDPSGFPLRSIPLSAAGTTTTTPITESPVEPGGTVSTAPTADGATPTTPVVAAVTSPVAGTVTIQQATAATPAPTGYSLLGQELSITAPAALSAADPLRLTFTLDASSVPAGVDTSTITVTRNGVPVTASCAGETAVPSPCLRSRAVLANGDLQIVVLTVAASSWVFVRAEPVVDPGPVNPGPTTPGPTVPGPTNPAPTVLATKLAGAKAQVVTVTCAKKDRKLGVRVGKLQKCFKLVVTAKLVEAVSGSPVAGHKVAFARVLKPKPVALGTVTSTSTGALLLSKPIVVPVKSRKTLKAAKAWLAKQYPKVSLKHAPTGSKYAAAPTVTLVVRR